MNVVRRAGCATAALLVMVTGGCSGTDSQSGSSAAQGAGAAPATGVAATATTPEAQAQQIYSTRCVVCHGTDGRGDGPGAAALNPGPRDYHDPGWQESVTDQEIESVIVYGGAAVGGSPSMVASPDLGSKPEVVAALREIIRAFGRNE